MANPVHTLSSVWDGSDADLLEVMLDFYPVEPPERILDATVNAGRFWKGSSRAIVRMDINPSVRPMIVGDNRNMPFADESFDVVVYDPPHIPNQGSDRARDFSKRFGLGETASKDQGYSLSHLYPPFLSEASRVLAPEGLVFAKVADYVHNHRKIWAHRDLLNAAESEGFTTCDCIIKVRKTAVRDLRWKVSHHARSHHSYWIILRKSKSCERKKRRTDHG